MATILPVIASRQRLGIGNKVGGIVLETKLKSAAWKETYV